MAAYQLPPDVDAEISRRMQTGGYDSVADMLRAALAALQQRDEEIAAIAAGLEDLQAGHVAPLREFDRDFRQKNNIPTDA